MEAVMEFLENQHKPIIIIGTIAIVLFIVLVRRSGDFTSRIFRGLLVGAGIGCVLHFLLDKDMTVVLITGIGCFLLTALFGRTR